MEFEDEVAPANYLGQLEGDLLANSATDHRSKDLGFDEESGSDDDQDDPPQPPPLNLMGINSLGEESGDDVDSEAEAVLEDHHQDIDDYIAPSELDNVLDRDFCLTPEAPKFEYLKKEKNGCKQRRFHTALMVFTLATDLSITQYTALREVLQLVESIDEDLKSLPQSLSTLSSRMKRNLPVMQLRAYDIDLDLEVLPPQTYNPKKAYRFELEEYALKWLSDSSILGKMHFGLGVINPPAYQELYHGDQWLGSLRTTSGQFPYLEDGEPIFPSDCVSLLDDWGQDNCLYRVIGVGRNGDRVDGEMAFLAERLLTREAAASEVEGLEEMITALEEGITQEETGVEPTQKARKKRRTKEQMLLARSEEEALKAARKAAPKIKLTAQQKRAEKEKIVRDNIGYKSMVPTASTLPNLILFEGDRLVFPVSAVKQKEWVHFLDYDDPIETLRNSILPNPPTFSCPYIVYKHVDGESRIKRVTKRHRLPAERELRTYGLDHVKSRFIQRPDAPRIVSLPINIFLDDFGLYRNAYHAISGLYIQPSNLNEASRFKLHNMFVLSVAPFGSDELDIASYLADEGQTLGRGKLVTLPSGEVIYLLLFPLVFTGDMPQQNKNCGAVGHNGNTGCRYCFCLPKDKGDMDFDGVKTGRYDIPHRHLYHYLKASAPGGEVARHNYFTKQGVAEEGHIWWKPFNCLDPFSSYPIDPMHSELRLVNYFQELIIGRLLSKTGRTAYKKAWNKLNLPRGWGRPQCPIKHHMSMMFSENGRIAQLNPLVLLLMLYPNGANVAVTKKGSKSYFKRGSKPGEMGLIDRIGTKFDQEGHIILIGVSYRLSQTVFLALKSTLTHDEREDCLRGLRSLRVWLTEIFKLTDASLTKVGFTSICTQIPSNLSRLIALIYTSGSIGSETSSTLVRRATSPL